MKIVVLTGSPHKNGTSSLLADQFIQGATESGHTVYRFDAAFEKVNFCLGCDYCKRENAGCVHRDAMDELTPKLLDADVVAFVTPLYYHDMPAQLKCIIDRFYAVDAELRSKPRQTVLLVTAFEDHASVMEPIQTHYRMTTQYLNWTDCGQVLALGCGTRGDIECSVYPEQAYELGKNL